MYKFQVKIYLEYINQKMYTPKWNWEKKLFPQNYVSICKGMCSFIGDWLLKCVINQSF